MESVYGYAPPVRNISLRPAPSRSNGTPIAGTSTNCDGCGTGKMQRLNRPTAVTQRGCPARPPHTKTAEPSESGGVAQLLRTAMPSILMHFGSPLFAKLLAISASLFRTEHIIVVGIGFLKMSSRPLGRLVDKIGFGPLLGLGRRILSTSNQRQRTSRNGGGNQSMAKFHWQHPKVV